MSDGRLAGRAAVPAGWCEAGGEAPMLDRPLEARARCRRQRDLGGEHLDQHLARHPVELLDDVLDLRPDPRVGRDDDRVRHLVGDEAGLRRRAAALARKPGTPTAPPAGRRRGVRDRRRCCDRRGKPGEPGVVGPGRRSRWCSLDGEVGPRARARRWRRAWRRDPSPWCSRRSRRRRAARRRCPRRASRSGARWSPSPVCARRR